jgi:hypothetical protein
MEILIKYHQLVKIPYLALKIAILKFARKINKNQPAFLFDKTPILRRLTSLTATILLIPECALSHRRGAHLTRRAS